MVINVKYEISSVKAMKNYTNMKENKVEDVQ